MGGAPEKFYAQVRFFARKKEDEKFQQNVDTNYKLEELISLFDIMNSVYDNGIANIAICNVLLKLIAFFYS